jgi:hypothetical protein
MSNLSRLLVPLLTFFFQGGRHPILDVNQFIKLAIIYGRSVPCLVRPLFEFFDLTSGAAGTLSEVACGTRN